ncbi:hypothetical protein V6N11_041730 [Hibiscus sabdariffa]|uniref:Uncharacterized protein n=1 Tax=Hibiscus sabdariffa TaxID=183260 RepID=A0ABR2RM16_9ROSI
MSCVEIAACSQPSTLTLLTAATLFQAGVLGTLILLPDERPRRITIEGREIPTPLPFHLKEEMIVGQPIMPGRPFTRHFCSHHSHECKKSIF